mgnify:FL=1|jgi:hypothetical protein|tara:strand:- start:343 stop:642 length:300 start_codon:yes stop_codon:yes gene_type:complete
MTEKSMKGTALEYKIISDLSMEGWFCAKSCDPQCPFDFIAVHPKTGMIRFIDVKVESQRKNCPSTWSRKSTRINRIPSKSQKQFFADTNIKIEIITEII